MSYAGAMNAGFFALLLVMMLEVAGLIAILRKGPGVEPGQTA